VNFITRSSRRIWSFKLLEDIAFVSLYCICDRAGGEGPYICKPNLLDIYCLVKRKYK
jgi:hypothetical protein